MRQAMFFFFKFPFFKCISFFGYASFLCFKETLFSLEKQPLGTIQFNVRIETGQGEREGDREKKQFSLSVLNFMLNIFKFLTQRAPTSLLALRLHLKGTCVSIYI